LKIIKQLFWIFLFSLLGTIVSELISSFIAIPGSVLGMILMFIALHTKILKVEQVDNVATWITANMAILFVPSGVGIMANFDVLADRWWQLLIIMLVTTIITMIFVGRSVQGIKRRDDAKKSDKKVKEG
jgi:holin-like protein